MDTFGAVKFPSWMGDVPDQGQDQRRKKKNYGTKKIRDRSRPECEQWENGRTTERKNWTTERKKIAIGLLRWGRLPGRDFDRPKWVHTESECPRTGSDQDQDPIFF